MFKASQYFSHALLPSGPLRWMAFVLSTPRRWTRCSKGIWRFTPTRSRSRKFNPPCARLDKRLCRAQNDMEQQPVPSVASPAVLLPVGDIQ